MGKNEIIEMNALKLADSMVKAEGVQKPGYYNW
jgi:hypothetical protein